MNFGLVFSVEVVLNLRTIDPRLVRRAKARAAERGVPLKAFVEEALEQALGVGADVARRPGRPRNSAPEAAANGVAEVTVPIRGKLVGRRSGGAGENGRAKREQS
jgi:hypothetical protein